MKTLFILSILLSFLLKCQGQNHQDKNSLKQIGGPCEGCEAIYEYGAKMLLPVDTLPGFFEKGEKLKVTGTIFQSDGKTPAKGVILYIYHTNDAGVYATRGDEKRWDRRHGYHRGWIKTGDDGKYTFYTIKPGHYPERSSPSHIHATIKEPGKNEYYIDSYHFEGDPLLTQVVKSKAHPKGGRGIVKLKKENGTWMAERNIILGLNIQGYE